MYNNTIEMLAFNLKLVAKKSKKNILISAGKLSDKEKILKSVQKLLKLNISIYATNGTSKFFNKKNIPNQEVYKITEGKEPNIKTLLAKDRFDLIINILTENHDYDESSDSNLIRSLSISQGIPLITDIDVAVNTIEHLLKAETQGLYKYKIKDAKRPWDLKLEFLAEVEKLGGFACYHAHFDKAYLISSENLKLSQVDMQKKWELYKYLKENYTHEDLIERMSRCVETMINQGITHCRTFVDADKTVKLLPIKAALEVKERYKDQIQLQIAVQSLEGLLDKKSYDFFKEACEAADIIGGLPSKDRPREEAHIDILFNMAKELNKKVNLHLDQENNPYERETELVALKTIEHGLEGMVESVHSISLSAKQSSEQDRIIKLIKQAKMGVIICPSAAISMKQLNMETPTHNSIAPFKKLFDANIDLYIGIDNIADLFMPLVDGDIWFEIRLLMEATRFYNIKEIAKIACNKKSFST